MIAVPKPTRKDKVRKPLRNRTPIKRTALKKKRPKHEVKQMGTPSRRRWVRTQPCCACEVVGYSENAHVTRRSGMGMKGPSTDVVPLCGKRPLNRGGMYRGCHSELDMREGGRGRDWLESTYKIDLNEKARETEARYQRMKAGDFNDGDEGC